MIYDELGMTERVLKIAKALEINDTELAKVLGLKRQFIPDFRKKISNVPPKRVIILLGSFKEINPHWLLFGVGDMFGKPGVHKATVTKDGEIHFSSDTTQITSTEELKRLQSIIEEKDKHNETLKETVEDQKEYINKLINKL